MLINSEPSTSLAIVPENNILAFGAFALSTIFIVFFSVEAIFFWSPLVGKLSLFTACLIPSAIAILPRTPKWIRTKTIPKEIIWLLLIFILGLISSIISENIWMSLKSIVLFIISGPLIFVTTKYLFEDLKFQEAFYWLASLILLISSIFGIYQYYNNEAMLLFSRNPLPAGAQLILISIGTIILLRRDIFSPLKLLLILSLTISGILIIVAAKKSHLIGIIIILLFLVFRNRKYLIYLLGFIVLSGCILYFSSLTLLRYKEAIHSNSSTSLRAENYFFGLHVINSNPIWGLGFNANLDPHFTDYKITFSKHLSKEQYQEYIRTLNTFENIVLTYLIEWGSLFSFTYFGGLLYMITRSAKKIWSQPSGNTAGWLVVSVIIGFSIMSFTFDTLRFPNLNWIFHSLLGLMVNLSNHSHLSPQLKTS